MLRCVVGMRMYTQRQENVHISIMTIAWYTQTHHVRFSGQSVTHVFSPRGYVKVSNDQLAVTGSQGAV